MLNGSKKMQGEKERENLGTSVLVLPNVLIVRPDFKMYVLKK